jgi:hypothetical protein
MKRALSNLEKLALDRAAWEAKQRRMTPTNSSKSEAESTADAEGPAIETKEGAAIQPEGEEERIAIQSVEEEDRVYNRDAFEDDIESAAAEIMRQADEASYLARQNNLELSGRQLRIKMRTVLYEINSAMIDLKHAVNNFKGD